MIQETLYAVQIKWRSDIKYQKTCSGWKCHVVNQESEKEKRLSNNSKQSSKSVLDFNILEHFWGHLNVALPRWFKMSESELENTKSIPFFPFQPITASIEREVGCSLILDSPIKLACMWEEVWVPGEPTRELVSSYWLLHIFASHPDDYSQLKYVDNGVQSPA